MHTWKTIAGTSLLALVLFTGCLCADTVNIPLSDKVEAADFIGVISIVITRGNKRELPDNTEPMYRWQREALAEVLGGLKGPDQETLLVEFDNSLHCPNVVYEAGKSYVVFLTAVAEGRYDTLRFEHGHMLIENDRVKWDEKMDIDTEVSRTISVYEALIWIRAHLWRRGIQVHN